MTQTYKIQHFGFMQSEVCKAKLPSIKTVNVFGDGPNSQFKQEQGHDYDIFKWNFFAISHGKGVVDGIEGTVK